MIVVDLIVDVIDMDVIRLATRETIAEKRIA